MVEHRYFPPSIPHPADWDLLNIEQAANDHHLIVEAFAPIYAANWISTGASKGGMTSLFHRRFFPNDVDGTIGYVTPVSLDNPDPRYAVHMDAVALSDCHDDVRDVQRAYLLRKDALIVRLADYAEDIGLDLKEDELEELLLVGAIDYEWMFWQYYGVEYCGWVSGSDVSDDELFYSITPYLDDMDSSSEDPFSAYYYQAYAELGYPASATNHLADLVDEFPIYGCPTGPWDVDPIYSSDAMEDILDWVDTEGSALMFIYGEYDPWTGGEVELGGATESYSFVAPEASHGASIYHLNYLDQQTVIGLLSEWAGVDELEMATFRARRDRDIEDFRRATCLDFHGLRFRIPGLTTE